VGQDEILPREWPSRKFQMTLREVFLQQAKACIELGSPFMGQLMTLLAHHWPNDTALAQRFATWEGDASLSGANVPLRLAGGLHAIVLLGKDAPLAAAYPPNAASDDALATAVLGALREHDAFLCNWVNSAPQTNEVRRSAVLIAAAHWLNAQFQLPLQLSELGASAGLNLQFDKFAMQIGEQLWGPHDATIRLSPDWRGEPPPQSQPRIAARRGVDLNPLRIGRPEDELRLISYIWPDQPDRITRARAAMALFKEQIDEGDAVEWLEKRLAKPSPGHLHLIYHTIVWQYFPKQRQTRGRTLIEAAGAAATPDAPLAWLAMEADEDPNGAALTLRIWPGDKRLSLGRAGFHGQWVDWGSQQTLPP
jgi:hypothetical protein